MESEGTSLSRAHPEIIPDSVIPSKKPIGGWFEDVGSSKPVLQKPELGLQEDIAGLLFNEANSFQSSPIISVV